MLTDIRTLFTLEQKKEIDRLFPQIFPPIPVRKLVGFYSAAKVHAGWFLAATWRDDDTHLFVRAHPNHPKPSEVFAPVMGYNFIGEDFDEEGQQLSSIYEVYAANDDYAAITMVEVEHGAIPQYTPAITCIKKEYLTKIEQPSVRTFNYCNLKRLTHIFFQIGTTRMPICRANFTPPGKKDFLLHKTEETAKFRKGFWVVKMDMVELLPEEIALSL